MSFLRCISLFCCLFLLHSTEALVEFTHSKLFDETDLAVQNVYIPNFCEEGCRIYVSIQDSSAEIARNIMVHDYINDKDSLYDISRMKRDDQKGYHEVERGNTQVTIVNNNPGFVSAPLAVWIVRSDASNLAASKVFDAVHLNTAPESFGVVTIMSAAPFTLRSKTEGPMILVATLSGYDSMNNEDDECTNVLEQLNDQFLSDVQISVQSPLISFFFDEMDYPDSSVSLTTEIGNVNSLDFSGISFFASPGYIGCKEKKTFRSSLYDAATKITYYSYDRLFDVSITSSLYVDEEHPVTIKDKKNGDEFSWAGNTDNEGEMLQQTNNVEISWTRNDNDLNQFFLVRVTPSNGQRNPDTPPTTLEPTPEATSVEAPVHDPGLGTSEEPEASTGLTEESEKTTAADVKPSTTETTSTTILPSSTTTARWTKKHWIWWRWHRRRTTTPPPTTTGGTKSDSTLVAIALCSMLLF